MRVDTSELNKLSLDLGRHAAATMPVVRRVMTKVCADTAREAKIFAPVDTGNLRNSIGYDVATDGRSVTGEVGPTAAYGHFVEFGTSRMGPHAYMGPAFDRNAGQLVAALSRLETL